MSSKTVPIESPYWYATFYSSSIVTICISSIAAIVYQSIGWKSPLFANFTHPSLIWRPRKGVPLGRMVL